MVKVRNKLGQFVKGHRLNDKGKNSCSKDYQLKWKKKHHQEIKQKIFDIYGRECVCCKETIFEFLTLDHINNDGAHDYSGKQLYEYLIKEKFKRKDIRVMCYNCNCGRRINKGICPHAS